MEEHPYLAHQLSIRRRIMKIIRIIIINNNNGNNNGRIITKNVENNKLIKTNETMTRYNFSPRSRKITWKENLNSE